MTRQLPIHDYAGLSASERTRLDAQLRPLRTLDAVLRWGRSAEPRWSVAEIVTQDEYTHDVVLAALEQPYYLAFDTS